MHRNEGIQMSGGSINANQLAVGHQAWAMNMVTAPWANETQSAEINKQLQELFACIDRYARDLERADELRSSVQDVATQLSKPKPNKTTVLDILGGIAAAASSVAGVAAAVDAVTQTVSKFL